MKAALPEATVRYAAAVTESTAGFILSLPKSLAVPPETMVEGTADGFPFRAAAAAAGLRLTEAQRKAIGANSGDTVTVEITRIGDGPEVMVPADLTDALAASPKAQALWEVITPMARREWVRWIASAKQQETRERRIEVGIDKLLHGMRRPCCFPGLNWVTKDHVAPGETWATLPSTKNAAGAKAKR